MRTGAAAGHIGYFHETAFYGSDDEYLQVAVPFLEDGRRAGEPTLVNCADHNTTLLRGVLGDVDGIEFLPAEHEYARPATTIQSYRKLFASLTAAGADQIRIIGEVPHPGVGAAWDGWARYEAAVNHAFREFPLWGICPYDTRTTPERVLAEVAQTHPHVATAGGGHHHNHDFVDPVSFLAQRPTPPRDPLELTLPALELVDPWPHDARQAIDALETTLPAGMVDDLVTAVSEIVTNARSYGIAPVRMRAWTAPERVVVTVHDAGFGTTDPFAGLIPPHRDLGSGGLGLWIVHQLCSAVSLVRTDDGFTVRLVAGRPYLAD